MTDVFSDLDGIYANALERLDAIRDSWFAEGQPLIGLGSTGQQVEHPLVKLLRESEVEVAKLGRLVATGRHPGPDPVAVIREGIGKAPSARGRRGRPSPLQAVRKPEAG